ncbi:succinate dehydrogenase/fumarate reductase iron-sulfur subunit [Chitinophaga sp. Mgbs1]|uniref:Succinate dehydrogenase/fumarate reductase iron-sulfur subunit n=1 Tax=Chitinophaga solisilvae TaxID=1233460 RepID=A0A433WGB1_9BACT|nr:succinate dehydrogenase/fumarate reductase iron-sulfur subunit [Chitinophaga solisilvae]
MHIRLKIWRQESPDAAGSMKSYTLDQVDPDMSFLEMLDMLNEQLLQHGERVIEFDHDCREGICGQCGIMINGRAHGPLKHTTTCQLHMRTFREGEEIWLEPFRAKAFPVKCDLKIDRSAFDRIIQAGGYISVSTGAAPEANSIPVGHPVAEAAFDAAACIGCGACVAVCKNSSAALFTGAKISHLVLLPQGEIESQARVQRMVDQMDAEGFGHCSNTEACEAECPQQISVLHIARMNWEFNKAQVLKK